MAVIQISKIQVRRGLQENLPQLASGEFGWSIDERRLFIGNGTLAEGAPSTGVTEILTEYTAANIAILETTVNAIQANVTALQANVTPVSVTLAGNTWVSANSSIVLNSSRNIIDYTIIRGIDRRVGTITITQVANVAVYNDEYSQTAETGVTLSVFAYGNTSAVLQYTTTNTVPITSATLTYYPSRTFS